MKITCGNYNRETIQHSHSVSIIKRSDACDCVIQSNDIQLIGSHTNCSSNGNFIIYHTYNFITEWLNNRDIMPYYRENQHILELPSLSTIPLLNVIRTDSANVFTEDTVPPISLHKFDSLINNLKDNKIYLSNLDKMSKDNKHLNATFMDSMVDNNDILDIDSWFDDDVESSMIFIFLSCIIALIAFLMFQT